METVYDIFLVAGVIIGIIATLIFLSIIFGIMAFIDWIKERGK